MLGERLRKLRDRNHLTQGQVAEYAKVSQSTLSDLELNKISPKTLGAVVNLSRFYECSTDYLLGETDNLLRHDLPEDQRLLLDRYGELNEEQRIALLALLGNQLAAAATLEAVRELSNSTSVDIMGGGGVSYLTPE